MKVEVREIDNITNEMFPKIMIYNRSKNGFILLVTKRDDNNKHLFHGVVLKGNGHWDDGYFSKTWAEDCFSDFNGSITLSND